MERLTEWNDEQTRHAYYPRCFEAPCYGSGCKIENCPFEAAACDRLAAYEDTGLEPEAIETVKLALAARHMVDLETLNNTPISRLVELAEADKDGRCVVLPCKVGDTVWIVGAVRKLYSAKVRTFFCGNVSAVRGSDDDGHIQMIRTTECDIPIKTFGKTVFLTREEAEKALAEMEGKKDGNETSM